MKTHVKSVDEPMLFDSSRFAPRDRTLFINRTKILTVMKEFENEDSLVSLRKGVFFKMTNL